MFSFLEFSLVELSQLFLVVFEISGVVDGVAEECENVLHRHVKVIVNEKIKLAANAIFLAPSHSVYRLDCVVEVLVDEIEL